MAWYLVKSSETVPMKHSSCIITTYKTKQQRGKEEKKREFSKERTKTVKIPGSKRKLCVILPKLFKCSFSVPFFPSFLLVISVTTRKIHTAHSLQFFHL